MDRFGRPQVSPSERQRRDSRHSTHPQDHSRRRLVGSPARIPDLDLDLHSQCQLFLFPSLQRSPLLTKVALQVSLYWVLYESLKSRFIYGGRSASSFSSSTAALPEAPPGTIPIPLRYTLCSVTACALAATTTTPVEVVQAKWQTSGGKIEGGIPAIIKEMWKQGGWRSFTRGMSMRIAYAVRRCLSHLSSFFRSDVFLSSEDSCERDIDDGLRSD
jgi:hypothetical protein